MGELFDPIFGVTAVASALDDHAWLSALCEVETALARACTRAGLIDLETALEIGVAAEAVAASDPAVLGAHAQAGGNPVIPLVVALRERVRERAGDTAAAAVHLGATSQDVLDTALALIAARALGVIAAGLADCAELCAGLAREHRDTVMCGRTLLQHAEPTTFGALAAVWGSGLDRAQLRIEAVRDALPVQLGGPAGTLAGLYPHGLTVLDYLADELELSVPRGVWHTERSMIAELAGVLGQAAATIAKVATDVVLLAQSELGEVAERSPGGSSSMPHKRNPIAAITARAGAAQAPGLVATLLASSAHELQRAAGPWHAEWPALDALLRSVGGATSRLRSSLDGLQVDPAAMRATLDAERTGTGRTGPSRTDTSRTDTSQVDTGHAGDLVDRYLTGRQS